MSKLTLVKEIFVMMKERKKWWLFPIIFFLIILGILIVLAQNPVLAPFIYTLF